MDSCVHQEMRGHMDTTDIKQAVARPAKRSWRRHSDEFKAHVIAMARRPGMSMAAVALANGLNANMLRRWVRQCEVPSEKVAVPADRRAPVATFVQLPMVSQRAAEPPAPAVAAVATVDVHITRGDTRIAVHLPLGSTSAAWLREVLG